MVVIMCVCVCVTIGAIKLGEAMSANQRVGILPILLQHTHTHRLLLFPVTDRK